MLRLICALFHKFALLITDYSSSIHRHRYDSLNGDVDDSLCLSILACTCLVTSRNSQLSQLSTLITSRLSLSLSLSTARLCSLLVDFYFPALAVFLMVLLQHSDNDNCFSSVCVSRTATTAVLFDLPRFLYFQQMPH